MPLMIWMKFEWTLRLARPRLSTPITKPPTIEPETVPIPPATAAPPMNTAAMASDSKPTPSLGLAADELGGDHGASATTEDEPEGA